MLVLVHGRVGGLQASSIGVNEALAGCDLGIVGLAAQGRTVGQLGAHGDIRFAEQLPGEVERLLMHERIVHPEEGLRGHGRDDPLRR